MAQITAALLKDPADARDRVYPEQSIVSQPSYSLRPYCYKPVFRQTYGTCAAHAAAQMVWYTTMAMTGRGVLISPMDLYWRTRERMGTLPEDSGSNMRAVMRALTNPGVLPYDKWPDGVSFRARPPSAGIRFRAPGYRRISIGASAPSVIRGLIAEYDVPVLAGFNFPTRHLDGGFSATGDLLCEQDVTPGEPVYGHCVLVDGWQDDCMLFLNSWGDWGCYGGGVIHESWLTSELSCVDIWTIDLLSTDSHGLT